MLYTQQRIANNAQNTIPIIGTFDQIYIFKGKNHYILNSAITVATPDCCVYFLFEGC